MLASVARRVSLSANSRRWRAISKRSSVRVAFSGVRSYREQKSAAYLAFNESTGIELEAGCGVDTSMYINDWHGVSPRTEIVTVDFEAVREARLQHTSPDLFAALAA